MTDFTWMIGGEAGFGIMTTGLSFSKIAARLGYDIFDYVEYPSLIRGGHNAYEVHVGDDKVDGLSETVDVLICLNEETYSRHKKRLNENTYVIYDPDDFSPVGLSNKIAVPLKKILSEQKGQAVMRNTIALGASLAVTKAPIDVFISMIREQFSRKGDLVVDFNISFAKAGYDFVIKNYKNPSGFFELKQKTKESLVMNGNDAFSLGAVAADCRSYTAYPMTPSSTVLSTLAGWSNKTSMVVRHAEDEIAAINTALGASFAGVRSAVGSSGGGFALMAESLSFSGIAEIPLVVFLAQRPGPATGMPTWTEQGDLLFTVHAGHGDFPKIVLAASDVYSMFDLTLKAFNLADVYQLPVIVLSDMYLSEGHQSVSEKTIYDAILKYTRDTGQRLS